MTKYKIGVFKSGEGRIIDLDKIIELKKLESIDDFTITFNSEEEFKLYLCKQELITRDELNHKIRISYDKDGKIIKMPIIYKSMEKYMDRMKLKQILLELSTPFDIYNKEEVDESIEFLEKLVNHYYTQDQDNEKGSKKLNFSDIKYYIYTIKCGGDILYNIGIIKPAINELYSKIVYKKVKNDYKVEYKNFRDLSNFIYKYVKKRKEEKQKKEQQEENDSFDQISMFTYQQQLNNSSEDINSDDNNKKYIR